MSRLLRFLIIGAMPLGIAMFLTIALSRMTRAIQHCRVSSFRQNVAIIRDDRRNGAIRPCPPGTADDAAGQRDCRFRGRE